MKFGLIGEHLKHSYSQQIHQELHGEEYRLYELAPGQVGEFLKRTDLDGINVTIPYKQTVMSYCVGISDIARRIGCVNTLMRRPDGWYGHNTDYDGFCTMLKEGGIDPAGKKALLLGSGGASLTARTVLQDQGVLKMVILSRRPQENPAIDFDTYDQLSLHEDAEVIVNTTPVGMYPGNGHKLTDLNMFPKCCGVADVIYNPARTALLLQAEELGIPHIGGLGMLTAQARRSAELWLNCAISDRKLEDTKRKLEKEMHNIVLIGMPGCGKTSIGKALQEITGRRFIDTDEQVEKLTGKRVSDLITVSGEEAFRLQETNVIAQAGKESGCIIATGGGCVTRDRNYSLLHQNSTIVWIRRDLSLLPKTGRPLSQASTLDRMYALRKDLYRRFADMVIDNDTSVEEAAYRIIKKLSAFPAPDSGQLC